MSMKFWKEEEIDFLKNNYPYKGLLYCIDNLEKNKNQIRNKITKLGLKKIPDLKYSKDFFKEVVLKSINLVDVCRNIGISLNYGNRQTIKKYINLYNLNIDHFYTPLSSGNKRIKINDILIEDSKYTYTTSLKEKLYKLCIKERKCELCGQDEEWNGKRMSLILDHINGINNDNRIENLRIVCPNCNATLDTHCKGCENKYKRKVDKKPIIKKDCKCGKEIHIDSTSCMTCSQINQRKVERPTIEQLLKDVNELGYSATGRKYGVSDNAIRKWIK